MPDPVAVNSMFARIARRYDVANRLLSGGLDISWRRKLTRAVVALQPAIVLDLATGSGDVAFCLAEKLPPQTRIIGMDFCVPMLDEAKIKQREKGVGFENIEFLPGDGLALPLADASIDVATISFGLRNMGDRHRCLQELRRVLRPQGTLLVLEFSQPAKWFRPLYFFYLRHVLPFVAGLLTGNKSAYVYLNETIEQFPDRAALCAEIQRAGFSHVSARGLTLGAVALHQATA